MLAFVNKASCADLIREFAQRHYVEPARRRGDSVVEIVAGDIHKGLHLRNLVPNVCQALSGRRFREENGLVLERRDGPASGQSTTAKFVFRIANQTAPSVPAHSALLGLRGIAKDLFRDLGGGEAFIRSEREQFRS